MAKTRKKLGPHGDTGGQKPRTWALAEAGDVALLKRAFGAHPNLTEEGRTGKLVVELLTVDPARDKTGHQACETLTVHGAAALARVRVMGARERVTTGHDAEIELALPHWLEASEKQKLAILDHELTHLEIVRDRDGEPRYDVNGHVRLRLRRHDYIAAGFLEVVQRHRHDSPEVLGVVAAFDAGGQQLFGFLGDHAKRKPRKFTKPRLADAAAH